MSQFSSSSHLLNNFSLVFFTTYAIYLKNGLLCFTGTQFHSQQGSTNIRLKVSMKKHNTFLKRALLALSLCGVIGLHANDVWVGNTDDILNNPLNWTNNTLPTSKTIAEFGLDGSSGTTLQTSTGLSVLGVVFDSTATNGYYIYNSETDTFSIGLSGVVNHSPVLQNIANDSGGAGLILFEGGSAGTNMYYSSYNTTAGGGITFLNSVDGSNSTFSLGSIVDTLTTNGDSSVGSLGNTQGVQSYGNIVIESGSLTVGNLNSDDYLYGVISGPGEFIFSTTTEDGYLGLTGANTYTGGTVVNAVGVGSLYTFSGGTLAPTGPITVNSGVLEFGTNQTTGNLSGTGGSVIIDSSNTLTVNQTTNKTYAGELSGAAGTTFALGTTGSSTAVGTLQLTGDSSGFAGDVVVNSGNLQVNNKFGGNSFTVNSGATLSGTGTFGTSGNLTTIASGGTLSPGNSVGVVTNAGNHSFLSGSFFRLEENGSTTGPVTPSNSLLIVDGSVVVDGGSTVNLVTTNGFINLNTKQTFLTTGTGLTVNPGGFALNTSGLSSLFNPQAYLGTLSYDANNYYILTQTQFASEVTNNGGSTSEIALASQLDSIVDPNTPKNLFLNELAQLSAPDLIEVLDDMSGAQYATEGFVAEVSNRNFIRRLYDPIREIVTTEPTGCYSQDSCCDFWGINVWTEVGGGQRSVNGYLGLNLDEWDATLGLQKTFEEDWTFGIAGSYEHNNIKYHGSNGSGNGYTWFGGLYGLYRPSCYYVLADIAYGYTQHKVNRHLVMGDVTDTFKGKPKISQVTFYAEAGVDFNLCSFLVQPFVGIEVAKFHRNKFSETDIDTSDLALNLHKKTYTTPTSSLGVHLTDQFCSGLNISVDLAWLYRFSNNNHFTANFESFGSDFTVYGKKIERSSGEGAITLSRDFENNWRLFAEASGEVWSQASAYNVLGGIQYNW